MAAKEVEVANQNQVMGITDAGFVWETVHVEAARQLQFTEDGDTYIGLLVECEWIDSNSGKEGESPDWFLQAKFEDPEGVSAINCGYELRTYFAPKGEIDKSLYNHVFRIQRRRTVDVGQASNMVSFRIERATPNADSNS
jgi:hypothetical protein